MLCVVRIARLLYHTMGCLATYARVTRRRRHHTRLNYASVESQFSVNFVTFWSTPMGLLDNQTSEKKANEEWRYSVTGFEMFAIITFAPSLSHTPSYFRY